MTWKQLPSLALGNECRRVSRGCSNCWRLQRLLEAPVTDGSCGDCWKLRWVAGEARNMMENALSILIVIFSVQLQQTGTSDRKLFIFQHGIGQLTLVYMVSYKRTHHFFQFLFFNLYILKIIIFFVKKSSSIFFLKSLL